MANTFYGQLGLVQQLFQKVNCSAIKTEQRYGGCHIEDFLIQMKIFAALALVTLFFSLEVAHGHPRYPVRQQQYYNMYIQLPARYCHSTTWWGFKYYFIAFHHGFVSFMQNLLFVSWSQSVRDLTMKQDPLKIAAFVIQGLLYMRLIAVA